MATKKPPLPIEVAQRGASTTAIAPTKAKASGAKTDVNDKGQRKPTGGVDAETREANEIQYWVGRVTLAEQDNEQWFGTDLPKLRKYVTGEQHNDGSPGLVRTNLIWSTIATNCPHIYAKDPEIEVSLTKAVPKEQYQVYKDFARSLQSILDSLFTKGAKLKLRAKSAVRSTMTTAVGWSKVIHQSDVRTDPITSARINDAQDNIQRILTLIQQIEKDESKGADVDAKKLELQEQMESLRRETEISTVHGMIIDRVLTEDLLILDQTIKDFDYYIEADAIAHGLWVTADKYQDLFGYVLPDGATPHDKPQTKPGETTGTQVTPVGHAKPEPFYRVFEIWHKGSNTVYTYAKGCKVWARPPYKPKAVGARWYPFFALGFNPVDGRWRPLSDVELLTELQDEYNTTRTNYAEARKSAIPVLIVRTGGDLKEEDVERIKHRKINQIIAVEGTPDHPISNEIAFLPTADINPEVYDTSAIRADFEQVSGTADAARGNIEKVKTATEADILQQGLMSRTDERRDVMEDWVADMAQYTAEILMDQLTKVQVANLVGQEAAQNWPELSRDRIFEMVQLRIKAGSSGRPNQQREREQWIALLPEIQKTIEQVFSLQMAGDTRLARTSIELLRETLERFDEYIDLDRFIPPEMQDGEQDATSQMMAELMQCKQQLAQLEEQNAELQQATQEAEQKAAEAQRGEKAKMIAADADAALEAEKARRADELKANDQRAKNEELRRKNTAESLSQARQLAFEEKKTKMQIDSAERIAKYKVDVDAKAAKECAERDAKLQKDQLEHTERVAGEKNKSAEKIAGDKNKTATSMAADKNKTTTAVAGDKNKTTVATAKMGNDTTVKTAKMGHEAQAQADDAALENEGAGDNQLATALTKLADALMADQVPVRGANGLIERVRKVPRAKAKPAAKAKPKK